MTTRTLINPNVTPRELWNYRQFVGWQYVDRGKPKLDKCPINPHRPRSNAGVTWPNTWADIRSAVATYKAHEHLAGIGFVLTPNDPYVMVDLDNCVNADGGLTDFAGNVLGALNTYTEYSPSVSGLRLFVRCQQQPEAVKRAEIEIYSRDRFATLTGNVLHDHPIARFDSLDWFIAQFAPEVEPDRPTTFSSSADHAPPPADDAQLWESIFKFNPLARAIYNGDLSQVRGNGDPSRAVILLANSLALWTKGDAGRMERMLRQTYLDKTKWDSKRKGQTWLDGRISDAINYMASRGAR